MTIHPDILHDNEAREALLDAALPAIGEQVGPWEIRGRIGKDVFQIDGLTGPVYTGDGLVNVTVYRMYVVERIQGR